jgi:hypothetical protein
MSLKDIYTEGYRNNDTFSRKYSRLLKKVAQDKITSFDRFTEFV